MNIIAKIKSYHLLVSNLLHNLQHKRKTSYLLILNKIASKKIYYFDVNNFTRSLSSKKYQTTNGNNNNKIMESTASNVKVGSGDNSNTPSGNTIPTFHRTSSGLQPGISSCQSNQQRSKESNNQLYTMHVDNDNDNDLSKLYYVVERNTVYRHTRFTCSSASNENKKLCSSRSLPDHTSLQNLYFLRNEHELKNIKRPISTGDIRKEQGTYILFYSPYSNRLEKKIKKISLLKSTSSLKSINFPGYKNVKNEITCGQKNHDVGSRQIEKTHFKENSTSEKIEKT